MDKNKAALISVFSNSTLIIAKLICGIFIGSISIISEAMHSSIDLIASLIALFSIKKASKAEDEDHPFGHGKYENVSGFVEAILILFAALIIIYEAASKLLHGVTIQSAVPGILVMLFSSIVNLFISLILLKISKKVDSIALEADGLHLLTDVFTSGGVFLGLVLLKITGIKVLDPIIAICVAFIILKTSITMIQKSAKDLVDHKLPDEDISMIKHILKSHSEVLGYHKLRTRKSGPNKEIDIHVVINKNSSLIEAHNICNVIENEVYSCMPHSCVTIHVEPLEDSTAN